MTKGRRPAVHVVRRRAETTRRVSRRPKASRLPQRRSPSRGTPERGSRSAGTRRALQPSGKAYRPTTKGCSTRFGGGEPQRTLSPRLAVERGRVPSLRTDRPTPAHRHASTILGATDGGLVAPPRTRRREETCPTASHLATACRRRETTTKVRCGSLPSSLGRGRAIARRAVRKKRAGSGGKRIGAGGNARRQGRRRPQHEAGAGEDRTLEVVLARHVAVAEVVRRSRGAEKRVPPLSPDWADTRGRAPSLGYRVRKHPGHGRRETGPHGEAETHVTALQPWERPAQGAGG